MCVSVCVSDFIEVEILLYLNVLIPLNPKIKFLTVGLNVPVIIVTEKQTTAENSNLVL